MPLSPLPQKALDFMDWPWSQMEPYYQELVARPLNEANIASWLADWSHLKKLVDETYARLQLANSRDTANEQAERRYYSFLDHVYPSIQAADQKLKEKLLTSGLTAPGFEIPLRNLRVEAALFREANLPLLAEEHKLGSAYNKIVGAQTVQWEGSETTAQQLRLKAQTPDRETRERVWRLLSARQLADREVVNALWVKFMSLRGQIAANAGFPEYRAYRWQQQLRFDYTPANCLQFHQAIEEVVVPAATRVYEKLRSRLAIDNIRPWDLDYELYPMHFPPLKAYSTPKELEERTAVIFQRVSPKVGAYFETMRREGLLDLENRKGKAPGAFCTSFATLGQPFVFCNSVGLSNDVRTLLHEAGHAFHVFERSKLPYHHQWRTGMEFNEVASMAMELLAIPYLPASQGGFYSEAGARRAILEQLENLLLFWPYMAIVDAFQHWVYVNHAAASQPSNCDAKWVELWQRFIPSVDWSGLHPELETGWHRKQHIHRTPFYYIEYGLAQLGAVQLWANALQDQEGAVESYLNALALGGTLPLPRLYETAGARFAFDAETLRAAVRLVESKIKESEVAIMA